MGLPRKLRGVGLHCFDFWSHFPSPIDCFLFAFPLDASLMLLLLDCISIECHCLEAAVALWHILPLSAEGCLTILAGTAPMYVDDSMFTASSTPGRRASDGGGDGLQGSPQLFYPPSPIGEGLPYWQGSLQFCTISISGIRSVSPLSGTVGPT